VGFEPTIPASERAELGYRAAYFIFKIYIIIYIFLILCSDFQSSSYVYKFSFPYQDMLHIWLATFRHTNSNLCLVSCFWSNTQDGTSPIPVLVSCLARIPSQWLRRGYSETCSHVAASNVIFIIQPIMDFIYLFPKSPSGSLRFFIWSWVIHTSICGD
jgi:hypothetical protein